MTPSRVATDDPHHPLRAPGAGDDVKRDHRITLNVPESGPLVCGGCGRVVTLQIMSSRFAPHTSFYRHVWEKKAVYPVGRPGREP